MTELVRAKRTDEVGIITLDVPQTRNALSKGVLQALAEKFDALLADSECRSIVLTGANGHFCSGGDISGMSDPRPLPVGRARNALGHPIIRAIAAGSKPVIAAVEGYAAGGGFSLVCGCDYIVAATTAKFVSSFARMGMIPDLGLLWSLPRRIGLPEAKRMFATARVVDSVEALNLGLVDAVVEPAQLLERAVALAREFAANAPLPFAIIKSIYARGTESLDATLAYELDNNPALQMTADHREAVAAFLEKRKPQFKGV
jgi:2-(1,2-epoxy-1,2-dihydrophenyl)acetyl-CoA isomerase